MGGRFLEGIHVEGGIVACLAETVPLFSWKREWLDILFNVSYITHGKTEVDNGRRKDYRGVGSP